MDDNQRRDRLGLGFLNDIDENIVDHIIQKNKEKIIMNNKQVDNESFVE